MCLQVASFVDPGLSLSCSWDQHVDCGATGGNLPDISGTCDYDHPHDLQQRCGCNFGIFSLTFCVHSWDIPNDQCVTGDNHPDTSGDYLCNHESAVQQRLVFSHVLCPS